MRVLGIDPGSVYCGYGLIRHSEPSHAPRRGRNGGQPVYLSSGRIVLPARKPLHARLNELYASLVEVIEEHQPDEIVIEKIFFAKGIKAALSLGHTRGVVLLAASLAGLPIHEYSPLEVKKAVVGYGRADKGQVESMVREILRIGHSLSPDSADALALALCHAHSTQFAAR
ncbi:MAG: crossover junction endodeoxyribonuclease RuvC [Alphaproteobacteria bacterium]|uniref:Crossover junction endodeoxyribonuclease RuvC n=1 Tax=Candidatus Nitrobium versatile TaxID=2884831 RepID=A0A953M0B7_9BACT|nr:crossover junction endodeoxyribonuclease RuvC [Candidatus Nitrobium versatile]